ncbi:MAG: 23S rRNA (uracil(1939)-C(5))-methyltransferase RlmD [Spirulinaceae cyanobacterium]
MGHKEREKGRVESNKLNNLNVIDHWQQGKLVEVEITDISDRGDGTGRFGDRVVFIPQTVTGDRVLARLVRVKPKYAFGKLEKLLTPSPHRIRPHCIVADKCGGCQWQHIDYEYQLAAKQNQVLQALNRIGKFANPVVASTLTGASPLGYRNKVTYPLKRSTTGNVQAGYYRASSHQLINLNQCPVQDQRLNPLLAEVKVDIQKQGWSIYNEELNRGKLRHLSLRIGRRTGEMLLTLVSRDGNLSKLESQGQEWLERYPSLVGVCLNLNPNSTNVIFGSQTLSIVGQPYLREEFAGLKFQLLPQTFFQVNTEAAERLLEVIEQRLDLQGQEVLVDAYCGIGTFTLPLAQKVRLAFGIELQADSVAQGRLNAEANQVNNVSFLEGTVKTCLPQLELVPDILLLDPPRKGCDAVVIETILRIQPQRLIYISCKPATLARDLKLLCQDGIYQLSFVQPIDLFPQTAHVESVAFLELRKE